MAIRSEALFNGKGELARLGDSAAGTSFFLSDMIDVSTRTRKQSSEDSIVVWFLRGGRESKKSKLKCHTIIIRTDDDVEEHSIIRCHQSAALLRPASCLL